MDLDAGMSTGTRERDEAERERGISQNKTNTNEDGNETEKTDLNRIRGGSNTKAQSTEIETSRLGSTTPNAPNANIEAGLSANIHTERQRHNSSPGNRTDSASGSASGSRSGSARGGQRVQEGKRQRIDNILEEARNRKIAMNANSNGGKADMEENPGPAGRGNGFGYAYGHSRESRGESSADEETSVLRRGTDINYGSVGVGTARSITANVNEGHNSMKRKLGTNDKDKRGGVWGTGRGRVFDGVENETEETNDGGANSCENGGDANRGNGKESGRIEQWWEKMSQEYGSIELENKGSVARDHLALERTFLAWLRTSLAFASIGIAITQLFRLNTSSTTTPVYSDAMNRLHHLGKPLGASFVGISILMLSVGFHRYFEGQFYIIRGKFPASRGSIALVAAITGLLMVTSLVVVVVGNRRV